MRHVVDDFAALDRRGELKVLAKEVSYHDVVILAVSRARRRKREPSPDEPFEAVARHACIPMLPITYEGGRAHFRVVALSEGEIPKMLGELGKAGKLTVGARIPVKDIPVGEPFGFSAGELFSRLTDRQARAFLSAAGLGYFQVPRRTKYAAMAKTAGVPRTTFETHVRKAESKIVGALAPYMSVHFGLSPSGVVPSLEFASDSGHLTANHYYRPTKSRAAMETVAVSEEFFKAIKEGKETKVRQMLQRNGDLANSRSQQGMSAVTIATYYSQPEIAQILISKGARLDLFEAAMAGRLDIVKEWIGTPGMGVNSLSGDGFTPLHLSSFFGHPDIVSYLLSEGADANLVAKNATKVRPLHSAAAKRRLEISKMLLEHGAEVDARQEGGFTALHAAALHGDLKLAKVLVEHGANQEQKTDKGKTALDLTGETSPEGGSKAARARVARYLKSKS